MMMGPMKKKMVTVGVISFLLPTVIAGVFFMKYRSDKEAEIAALAEETAVVQRYVFSGDLPVNHIIGQDDIKLVGVKEASVPLDAYSIAPMNEIESILGSPIGRKLKIPVFDKTIVAESMFYTEDDVVNRDDRKKEFNMITLPSDLVEGDYIDIRMIHPTGQDYLVVSAKEVLQLGVNAETNTVFLELNEDELVRLSAAIIESYIADSIHLYAVKYVNSKQQLFEEEKVDFVEKYEVAIQELISGDYDMMIAEGIANGQLIQNESGDVLPATSGDTMPIPKTVFDFTIEQIATQAGLDLEIAKRIQEANGDVSGDTTGKKDELLLTYFSNQTKVISEPLVANYPIKEDIYTLIQRNPNILETIKQKYNVEQLILEREGLINTDVFKPKEDDYGYGFSITGEEEMEEDETALGNIVTNLDKEIETQKEERKEFLQNLIRNNIAGY